jgi:hypothetical protein
MRWIVDLHRPTGASISQGDSQFETARSGCEVPDVPKRSCVGLGRSPPPRTVAPITRPALTNTRFFTMYCPLSVSTNGILWKVRSGKKSMGMTAPGIYNKSRRNVARSAIPVTSPTPIKHSHVTKMRGDTRASISPNVMI